MDNDLFGFKTILTLLLTPLTFFVGWYHKNLNNRIDSIDHSSQKLNIVTTKNSIRIEHLEEFADRFENKMDNKLNSIDQKLDFIIKNKT